MFGRGTPGEQPEYGSSGPDPAPWTAEARPTQTTAQRREELERWQAATVRVSVEALEPKTGSQFSLTAFWDPDSPPRTVVSSTGSDDRDARKSRRRLTTSHVYPALTQGAELPTIESPSAGSFRSVSGSTSATDGRTTTTDDAESAEYEDPLQEVWAEVEEVVEERAIDDDATRAEVEAILRASTLTTGEKRAVIEAVLDESTEDPQSRRSTLASMLRRSTRSVREVVLLEEEVGGTLRTSRASSRARGSSRLGQDGEELPRITISRPSSSQEVAALLEEDISGTHRSSRTGSRVRGSSRLEQLDGEEELPLVIITRPSGAQEVALLDEDIGGNLRTSRASSRVRGSSQLEQVEGGDELLRLTVSRPSSGSLRRESEGQQDMPNRRTFRRTTTRDPDMDGGQRLSLRRQTPWPEGDSRSSTRESSLESGTSTSVSDNDAAPPRPTVRTTFLEVPRPSQRRSTARTSNYMDEMPRPTQRRSTRSRSRLGTSSGLEGVAEEEGPEADERRTTSRQSRVKEDHPRDLQNEGYRRDDDDDQNDNNGGSCRGGCGRLSSRRNSRLRGSVKFEASGPRSSQRNSRRRSSGGARDGAGGMDAPGSGYADGSEATTQATLTPTTKPGAGRCRCTCGRGGGAVCRKPEASAPPGAPQGGSGGDPLDILCRCCRETVLAYTGRRDPGMASAARSAGPDGPQPPPARRAQAGCSCCVRRAAGTAAATEATAPSATGDSAPHRRSASTPGNRGRGAAAARPPCNCCAAARNRDTSTSRQTRGVTPAATSQDLRRNRSPARPATMRAAGDDCNCCGKRAGQPGGASKTMTSRALGGATGELKSRAIWRWPRCLLVGAIWLVCALLLLQMLWSLVTVRCPATNTIASCWAGRFFRATDIRRLPF